MRNKQCAMPADGCRPTVATLCGNLHLCTVLQFGSHVKLFNIFFTIAVLTS